MGNIDWGHLFWEFNGRINRGKWWLVLVVTSFFVTVAWSIVIWRTTVWWFVLATVVTLFAIWPTLAAHVKRFHDRDKPGVWVLVGFIPVIGGLWLLVELGFLEGSRGENNYGLDPLAPAEV